MAQLQPLRDFAHPDLTNHVVHLTGRRGGRSTEVPNWIRVQTPDDRLESILRSRAIQGFPPMGLGLPPPLVCFSECTPAGIRSLLREGRYAPWGIAFRKDVIFARGGGPVWYVRGDEWDVARNALRAVELDYRLVRYWPGMAAEDGEQLARPLQGESEWLFEREWRLLGDFSFEVTEVSYLITGMAGFANKVAAYMEGYAPDETIEMVAQLPELVLSETGDVICDGGGFWSDP